MRPSRRLAAALGVAVSLAVPASAAATISAYSSGPTVLMWQAGPSEQPVDLSVTGDGAAVTAVSRNGVPFGPPPYWSGAIGTRLCTGQDSTTTCTPPEGHPRLLGMSPILSSADDVFDASGLEGVGLVVAAKEGNDVVWGGSGDDGLTGWTGVDELHGGPGNDYLYLSDHGFDVKDPDSSATDCGPGTDVVKRDFEDPPLAALAGCELEIPDFIAPPVVAGTPAPGTALTVTEPASTGTANPASYAWRTCDPGGACGAVVGTGATFTPTVADVGREVTAHISRSVVGPDNRNWAADADARSTVVTAAPPVSAPAKDTTAPTVAVARTLKATAARNGRVTLKLGTASEAGTGTLKLSLKGKTAGSAKVTLVAGRTTTARVRLPARVRKALRRPKTLAAVLTTRDAAGNTGTSRFRVKLRTTARP